MNLHQSVPHRRQNILTGEWVLISPHRNNRPWQGKTEDIVEESSVCYDPQCYLCPGNKRFGEDRNPAYTGPYAFTNDFGALLPDVDHFEIAVNGLIKAKSERGICRVICFSPDHSRTLPLLTNTEIAAVIRLWMNEYREISKNEWVSYIQIFENKGAIMGCSNPHPHGQIWASENIPVEILKKQERLINYWLRENCSILQDYLRFELNAGERIIFENEGFVVLVPFWAVWPFETMIIPKRRMASITEMKEEEVIQFSEAVSHITTRYDNIYKVSFPYSAGIHQAPVKISSHPAWHWHMVFYPPLLRSATVKKFMVGYEMLAGPQRDITPETAAEILRSQPDKHFTKR